MKNLYKFYVDCGRMGFLDGLFLATEEEVQSLIGKEIYFGEVLGKHSEIVVTIEQEHITLVSNNSHFNSLCSIVFDNETVLCGYNPLDYYEEEEDEEGCKHTNSTYNIISNQYKCNDCGEEF